MLRNKRTKAYVWLVAFNGDGTMFVRDIMRRMHLVQVKNYELRSIW